MPLPAGRERRTGALRSWGPVQKAAVSAAQRAEKEDQWLPASFPTPPARAFPDWSRGVHAAAKGSGVLTGLLIPKLLPEQDKS